MTLGGGLDGAHRARPRRARPSCDDHRIDGTPVLPGVMGMEAFAEAAARAAARLAGRRARGRRAAGAVQVLPRRAAHARAARAACATAATARSWPTASSIGRRTLPGAGRAGDACTSRAACGSRRELAAAPHGEAPPAPPRPGARRRATTRVYRVYFHGPAYQVLEQRVARATAHVVGALRRRPAARTTSRRPARREFVPRLIELCFQTAGVWELGTDRPDGRCRRTSTACCASPAPTRPARCAAVVTPARRRRRSTPTWSTRTAACASGSRATARSTLPGGLDDDALAPLRAAMADALSMPQRPFTPARRSSTAASRRCG